MALATRRGWLPSRAALACVAIFAVAAAARLATTFRHGTWKVDTGYDASVYFAAADALVRGRMPYGDFIMLHPPGLILALTPFGALTYLVSDPTAFGIATIAFALLGGVNAVLVVRVAQRFELSLPAALAGGAFYALWFGAIEADHVTKLEPLGNFCLLLALLFAADARRNPQLRRPALISGAALGFALSVKIWWIVPLALLAVWLGITTRRRAPVGRLLGGAGVTAFVVNLPFFIAAPGEMWQSVIVDQLSRNSGSAPTIGQRIDDLTSAPLLEPAASHRTVEVVAVLTAAVLVLAAVRAVRQPVGRAALVLVVAQFAVLAAAPIWFSYYADFVAVPIALIIAAAAAPARSRPVLAAAGWLPIAAVGTVTGVIIGLATAVATPFHGVNTLNRAVQPVRCVLSDSPMALIELNALSRGLSDGCPNWIDVSGWAFKRHLSATERFSDRPWQRAATRYLRSGGAVIIVRAEATGLSKHTVHAIQRDRRLAAAGGHSVYRTGP